MSQEIIQNPNLPKHTNIMTPEGSDIIFEQNNDNDAYEIFMPSVDIDGVTLTPTEVVAAVKPVFERLRETRGPESSSSIAEAFGNARTITEFQEISEDRIQALYDKVNDPALSDKEREDASTTYIGKRVLQQVIQNCADVARASGFNTDTAVFNSLWSVAPTADLVGNVNDLTHSDGLSGTYKGPEETTNFRRIRFVLSTQPGTVVDPKKYEINDLYLAPNETSFSSKESFLDGMQQLSEHADEVGVPEEEFLLSNTKFLNPDRLHEENDIHQVMPGHIMVFDPTKVLMHSAPNPETFAPDDSRESLIVDVMSWDQQQAA